MSRWRRHLRLGLGLFAVGFAVALWLVVGERRAPPAPPPLTRLEPKAPTEIWGGDVLQHKGTKRDVRVEFGSQIAYADGTTKLTTFKAFIDDRGGRSFVLAGNEAMVGKDLSSYDIKGNVTLKTSDGLEATTPEATFTEAEGVVRGAGPVEFRRGRLTGSGVGFTYDRSLDRLWLVDKASINVAPTAEGGGMQVTAGAAGYSRKERYIRLERGMRMERQNQVIEAEQSTVFLLKDRDEPEIVELRGRSTITGAAGSSSLQSMAARDINLRYAADGRTLQQALLMGQGAVQLGRTDGSAGQRLEAETIDAGLAPDGSVTQLIGRDHVRVTLPSAPDVPPRTITATLLDAVGQPGRGLTAMTFDGGVEYREDAAKTAGRVTRARTMKAALSPDAGVETAEFFGGFRLEEGKLVATSADAVYRVAKGTVSLKGSGRTGRPHVADERVTIDADAIDVTLSPRQMTASGSVRTELPPGRRREGERGNALLKENEAVIVTADGLVLDDSKSTYKGQAHVFQASGTSIRGDAIAMDEKAGTLNATGGVVSTLPIAGRKEDGAKGTSIARAQELRFDDAKRQVVFTGKAQFDGVQGNLNAERIELFLAAADNTLEKLEAYDAVTVLLDKRQATGQRMTYEPEDEKYILTGTPVRLVQECQESTGRLLTFWKSSDRIQVDGNETRVQTKGGKCPEPPRF